MRILIYDGSIPAKGKDIYGAREGVPNCRFAKDAIAVSNLNDMIEKITAKCTKEGKLVSVLTSCGHAAPGSMAVGGIIDPNTNTQRLTSDLSKDLEYRDGDVQGPFKDLQSFLKPNALFFLAGCDIAEEPDGKKLLEIISQKLPGVWVVGIHTEVCFVENEEANRVEVHFAMNQHDKGLIDPMNLKVAYKGKIVDEDEWPENLIECIALWPMHEEQKN